MQPRTKLQVQVSSLRRNLYNLSQAQKEWAYKNCLYHKGYRTKKSISCLDCGHIWPGPQKVKSCICPECRVNLTIEDTRKKKYSQYATVGSVEMKGGFQVNRFFYIWSHHTSGDKPSQFITEVVQQWFIPGEKLTIIARSTSFGSFCMSSAMEIRANITSYWNSNKFDLYVYKIFPGAKCFPEYKRNGFSSKIKNVQLYSFFKKILHDTRAETLLKAGQFELLSCRLGNRSDAIHRFWDSIKICIRNKYKIKDGVSYLDYLELLHQNGKDLRSPKYVCPINFKKQHNILVAKRQKIQRIRDEERYRLQEERNIIHAAERKLSEEQDVIRYKEEKAPYLDLLFSSGNITIKILESVEEFKVEGEELNHCIHRNRYYNMVDSLCFSARIDGIRMETIEISISKLQVIQSRGKNNVDSKYHDQIVDLMKKNLQQVAKRIKASQTASAKLIVQEMEAA